MPRHEYKLCPRCAREFECKAGNVLYCQCTGVELQPRHFEFIAARYDDCLCLACLHDLKAECDS